MNPPDCGAGVWPGAGVGLVGDEYDWEGPGEGLLGLLYERDPRDPEDEPPPTLAHESSSST
jgi:hypothetical protein